MFISYHIFFQFDGFPYTRYFYQIFFIVKINKEEIKRLENNDPRSFENVRIYAGDSFYDPANARFKNLKYENIKENPKTIGKKNKKNKACIQYPPMISS